MCIVVGAVDAVKSKEIVTRKRVAGKSDATRILLRVNKKSSYQKLRIPLTHDDIAIDLQRIKTAVHGHDNRASRSKTT